MQNRAFSFIEQVSAHAIARISPASSDHLDLLPILPVYSVTHHAGSDPTGSPPRKGEGRRHSIGPAMISAGILRLRYWPAPSRPRNCPFSTTTLPRRIVTTGQAKMSWPSQGV